MKILDTDHCVAILRKKIDPQMLIRRTDDIAITAITLAELAHGANRSTRMRENLQQIQELSSAVNVLEFDTESAYIFGSIKHELEVAGHPLEDIDLQIASICLRHTAVLVTHNQRHYRRIRGLVLEDWLLPTDK
jgi:tRNA(fMet)-specific endonuclease VapC